VIGPMWPICRSSSQRACGILCRRVRAIRRAQRRVISAPVRGPISSSRRTPPRAGRCGPT
jgi:hypothetical protein